MADNTIKLKISIDNKEAIASIQLTDENIQQLYKSFKFGQQAVNGFETSIARGFDNARQIIQGFRETYSALQNILGTPVQAAIDMEQSIVSFEVLLGSGEKAKQMIGDLREFAAKTPLQLSGLQENAKLLLSFGIEAQNVLPYLKMLGDISGGNAQKMNQLALAFAQMQSTGRLMGQDLLQMINAGFNPLQIIAEKTGKSIGELKKEMEDGAISSEMIIQAFKDATSEGGKFYGMLEKQSETLGGKLSTLQDNFQQLQQQIGGTIAIGLSPLIEEFSKALKTLNEFSPELTGLIGTFGTLTAAAFTLKTTGLLPLIGNLQGVKSIFPLLREQMSIAGAGVGLFQKSLIGLSTTLKGLAASIGPAGWLILGVTALTAAINLLSSSNDKLSDSERQVIASADAEKIKFEQLTKTILDQNISIKERNKAKEEAQKLYPGFLENLSIEKINYEKLSEAVKKQTEEFRKLIELKILNQRLELAIQDLATKQNEDVSPEFLDYLLGEAQSLFNGTPGIVNAQVNAAKKHAESIAEVQKKIDELLAEIDAKNKETGEIRKTRDKLTEEEKKKLFEKNKILLSEAQRHQAAILKLETDNDIIILQQKAKHINEMIKLYKNYGQDVTALVNQLKETELELAIKLKPPEIKIDEQSPFEAEELPDIQYGNILDYARLSKEQELELWRKTELEKVAAYENSAEMTTAIEEEYKRRREELKEQELQNTLNNYTLLFENIGGIFAQHTAAYKAMAIAQTIIETYRAATAALSPPPIGAGPILGPILAIATIAKGMANVAKIQSTKIGGFALGGRLRKGEQGFFEGFENEIIAPEKTFIEIFKSELRPKIYADMSVDNSKLINEIKLLRKDLSSGVIKAVAYLDDREARRIYNIGNYQRRKLTLD
ncbi:Putative viral A-type inclusion protein [Ignavibacterium album JCM 16511]|uniref:Putative viral A-type inclusion protein n=1 Tax=Ignavibacterium album (strain DSM 19864 / JCM 16511 / NBRC 101810 / Mat9-16) TaxID=945713 RepID=I0AFN0_IGNAJ|nr:tape measure protein [Ignavibacterium album]AFH47787.1 Putative viral A-type inclusion protein [Ignavibacterium album JCM 16511]